MQRAPLGTDDAADGGRGAKGKQQGASNRGQSLLVGRGYHMDHDQFSAVSMCNLVRKQLFARTPRHQAAGFHLQSAIRSAAAEAVAIVPRAAASQTATGSA